MRRFLKIVFCLILLLIVVAVAIPFIVPADKIKGEVLAQIEVRTGRKVSLDHLSFSIFPTIALDAENVKIGNPAWAGGGDMAEIKTLKLGLELMPLLHKEIVLKELTLEQPVIALIKQQGRANWDLSAPENTTAPSTPKTQAVAKTTPRNSLGDLHLNQITITNGSATYKEDASPKTESISDINFSLKAPDFNARAQIKLSAVFEGRKSDIDVTLDKPMAFQSNAETGVTLDADYAGLAFNWKGTATNSASGIPTITGAITIPKINTNDFASKEEGKPQASASAPPPSNAARWSDAPIHLDGLARANADLTVAIGTLTLPKTTLSDIHAHLLLKGGTLTLAVDPIKAYGGTIALALAANTSNAIRAEFTAAGAEAEPLLHDFASYDRLSGTINLKVSIATIGASQRAMVNALSGNGSVAFKDGKLKGVNLAGLIRNVGGASSEEQSTDFSELAGTFTIAKGVVTTSDFKMNSPLLRVTGAGSADLPNWQEHFVLKPTLVGSLQGQGSKQMAGITVPVDVDGPIDHPHYQPDLKAAIEDNLKNPAQLKQTVKDFKANVLNGGKINSDTLKGLLR